jgi:hypothetical protein
MRHLAHSIVFFLLVLSLDRPSSCATVTIRATDSVGAENISKVLTIIRSLDGKGEITRGLTNDSGTFSALNIGPGLYEVISLYPYGYWRPNVTEFVVDEKNVFLQIRLNGGVIDKVALAEREVIVRVVDDKGTPLPKAKVLGRDLGALYVRFSSTDEQGRATITIPCEDSQIVVIYQGQVAIQDVKETIGGEKDNRSQCASPTKTPTQGSNEILVRVASSP